MTSSQTTSPPALPPVGEVPERMLAQVIRQDRLGEPRAAFRPEEVATPAPGPGEVLVGVMAAGINFNNVWAARGVPIDVIAVRAKAGDQSGYHVGGSDAAGIVYALGDGVEGWKVQGSHGSNDEQARAYNELIASGAIHPALGRVRPFDEIPAAHQDMADGALDPGNTVILIGAQDANGR